MKVVRLPAPHTHRNPRNIPGSRFYFLAEWPPGPQCGRKDYVNKNRNYAIGNGIRNIPACYRVPQTREPPLASARCTGKLKSSSSPRCCHTKQGSFHKYYFDSWFHSVRLQVGLKKLGIKCSRIASFNRLSGSKFCTHKDIKRNKRKGLLRRVSGS